MLTDLFFHDEAFYQYCEKNYIDADWKEIRQIINWEVERLENVVFNNLEIIENNAELVDKDKKLIYIFWLGKALKVSKERERREGSKKYCRFFYSHLYDLNEKIIEYLIEIKIITFKEYANQAKRYNMAIAEAMYLMDLLYTFGDIVEPYQNIVALNFEEELENLDNIPPVLP